MNFIITGSSGFLGSELLQKLKFDGHNVVGIDRVDSVFTDYIADLTDSSQYAMFDETMQDTDVLIHFASSVGVKNVDEDKNSFWNSHLINFNILNKIRELKQQNKLKSKFKIVFASSSEVYFQGRCLREQDDCVLKQLNRSSYASEKINTEFAIKNLDIDYIIIRPFNIIGKRQTTEGMCVPTMINQILNGEPVNVYNDGSQIRTFCDVEDFVNIVSRLISNKETGIFNIGNNEDITIKKLAETLLSIANKPTDNIKYIDFKDVYSNQTFEVQARVPSIQKIKEIDGLKRYKFKDLRQSLKEIYEYKLKEFNK